LQHDRDFSLTYAGIQQLIDKYLVKDRTISTSYETPQYAFMLIAMTAYMDMGDKKLVYVKELYDLISSNCLNSPFHFPTKQLF
jgi:ribonucleoside-diphosphate reductase alpha chain